MRRRADKFKKDEGYHKRRLSTKPDITGMWQVSGRNDIEDFEEVVKLDLEYIDNWCLALDIKIILTLCTSKGCPFQSKLTILHPFLRKQCR